MAKGSKIDPRWGMPAEKRFALLEAQAARIEEKIVRLLADPDAIVRLRALLAAN